MAVRVRVRIGSTGGTECVETTAVANSGFEANTCEILIPWNLAEKLGVLAGIMAKGKLEEFTTVGGTTRLLRFMKGAEVALLLKDMTSICVQCDALVSEADNEVLLSDTLIEALRIEIKQAGKGIWRLADDPSETARDSEAPQYW